MKPVIEEEDMSRFYTRRGASGQTGGLQTTPQEVELPQFPKADAEGNGTMFGGTRLDFSSTLSAFQPAEASPQAPQPEPRPAEVPSAQGKVLSGFLLSYARKAEGESWPLYEGVNTIGTAADNQVLMADPEVSSHQGAIEIMPGDDGTEAQITDFLSVGGTFVNGKRVQNAAMACADHDKITFGKTFEALLVLIDRRKYGLESKPTAPVEQPESPPKDESTNIEAGGTIFDATVLQTIK